MFDSLYSVINWMLMRAHLIEYPWQWLGEPGLAMWSVIILNVWRGFPFSAVILLASGRGSWIHNPVSAYRTIEGQNKERADKIWVQLSPRGPVVRRSFANCRAYGITKFSKNPDGSKAFLEALVDNYKDGFRASTGYDMPFLRDYAKGPYPIISEDPKLKPLEQDTE